MIQIHGDRMCGSFSSSIYNHRTDEYGGTAENRARFAVEAVSAVRENCRICQSITSLPSVRRIHTTEMQVLSRMS